MIPERNLSKIYIYGCRANSKIGINQECLFLHCSRYLKYIHQKHLYTEMGSLLGAVLFVELQKLELSIKYAALFFCEKGLIEKIFMYIHHQNNQNRTRRQLPLESTKGKSKIVEYESMVGTCLLHSTV